MDTHLLGIVSPLESTERAVDSIEPIIKSGAYIWVLKVRKVPSVCVD